MSPHESDRQAVQGFERRSYYIINGMTASYRIVKSGFGFMHASCFRVVVVDDEAGIRELIVDLLKGDGFEVLEAIDGADAIELINNTPAIDLVITDINMPGASGCTVAKAVRQRRPGTGIIFISGRPDEATRLCGLARCRFLQKPFRLSSLLALVYAELPQTFRLQADVTSAPRSVRQ